MAWHRSGGALWALLVLAFGVMLGAGCGAPGPVTAPQVVDVTAEMAAAPTAPKPDSGVEIPVTGDEPTEGNPLAPVTLVEWGDFQCPFCARNAVAIRALREAYGDKLRVVWRHRPLPFQEHARPAALAAEAVFRAGGERAFWAFYARAFENQAELTPENFVVWAIASGVDKQAFALALQRPDVAAKVDADAELGVRLGVSGIPTTFVNGVFLSGAHPVEKFKEVIDQELRETAALARAGVPPARIYAERSDKNHKAFAGLAKTPPPDDPTVWRVPVGGSPVRGKATALVTIVMFSDFQCPFCGLVQPTLDSLRAEYGDRLRIVAKSEPLPFHPRAEPAAELALEARAEKGDDGFWKAFDLLFANQQKLDDADLQNYAKTLGLDPARVAHAISSHKYKKILDEDDALFADVAAKGTPHFFINGRRLIGAQPIEKFRAMIDEEIGHATEVAKGGVAPAKIYEALQKGARALPTAPPPSSASQGPNATPSQQLFGAKHLVVMYVGSRRAPAAVTRTHAEAFARVLEASRKAKRGVRFEDLVTEYSDEPGAAARGGDLGKFPKGAMVPEFQEALERLPVGVTSEPVETPFGYHLILRTQ